MERCAQRPQTAHPAKHCMTRRSALLERVSAKQARATVANSSCREGKVQPPRFHSQAREGCSKDRLGSAYHGQAMQRGVCTLAFRKIWVRSGFGLRERVTPIVTVTEVSESTWPGRIMIHYDSKRMRSNLDFREPAGERI